MASPPHDPSTMEKLPSEILSDIFFRLFAKQLAQMRSVSKSWNAFLSESSFIKSHLHRCVKNNDKILLVFRREFDFDSKPFTAHSSRSPDIQLTDFIKHPVQPQSEDSCCRVIGSANGLICFSSTRCLDSSLHIWNPSLNAMMTIPPFRASTSGWGQMSFFMRFGYDPKSDDYKIVKLIGLFRKIPNGRSLASCIDLFSDSTIDPPQAEIYSMRKGSWQLFTLKSLSHITWIEDQDEVFVDGHDGHLHCLCYSELKGKRQVILAIDLGDDTFSEIPLPSSLLSFRVTRSNFLGRLGGELCVVSIVVNGGCELWLMKEYGMSESWVKCRGLPKMSGIAPYGFTSHLEFCFQAKNRCLFLYDRVAAKLKMFKLSANQNGKYRIVEYVDSLVWVHPVKCENSCSNLSQLHIGI